MEGRSLVPVIRGKELQHRPVFSMNLESQMSRNHQITGGTIAVWENDYKLIHYLDENRSLLFNLKQDPNELENIVNKEPEVGKRLQAMIQENLRNANKKIMKAE